MAPNPPEHPDGGVKKRSHDDSPRLTDAAAGAAGEKRRLAPVHPASRGGDQ
jgi:hypothetical protein